MKITSIFIFSLIMLSKLNLAKAQEVKIGSQIWTTKNLSVLTFLNGDSIPKAQTSEEWVRAMDNKQPAWCYSLNSNNIQTDGILYNFYAVNDSRGIAPKGWRIASNNDWSILIKNLGGNQKAFYYLKINGNSFKACPMYGYRVIDYDISTSLDGTSDTLNKKAPIFLDTRWWASDKLNNDSAGYIMLSVDDVKEIYFGIGNKGFGCSVLCIKE